MNIFLHKDPLNILYNFYFLQQSRARAESMGSLVPEDVDDNDEHFTAEQMIQFLNNLAKENNELSVGREVKWGVWNKRRKLKIRLHVLNTTLRLFYFYYSEFENIKHKTHCDSGIWMRFPTSCL